MQEWLQGRKMAVPTYRIAETRGKAHEQVFVVACDVQMLPDSVLGEGLSRRAAEQAAAKCALEQLMQMPDIKPPVAARKAAKSPRN